MPLAFDCPCGASFTVPEHLASEWGRCPQCERALQAPALAAREPGAVEAVRPFEVVRVGCDCGREVSAPLVRVRSGEARCPTCDRRLAAGRGAV